MKIIIFINLFLLIAIHLDAQKKKNKEGFIVTKDSAKITGTIKVEGYGIEKGEKSNVRWVVMNGVRYEVWDLLTFENSRETYTVIDSVAYTNYLTGKIQVYITGKVNSKFNHEFNHTLNYSSNTWVDVFYLRKEQGELIFFTTKALFNLIQDNQEALTVFHKYYKKVNDNYPRGKDYENLDKVLKVYDPKSIVY